MLCLPVPHPDPIPHPHVVGLRKVQLGKIYTVQSLWTFPC